MIEKRTVDLRPGDLLSWDTEQREVVRVFVSSNHISDEEWQTCEDSCCGELVGVVILKPPSAPETEEFCAGLYCGHIVEVEERDVSVI